MKMPNSDDGSGPAPFSAASALTGDFGVSELALSGDNFEFDDIRPTCNLRMKSERLQAVTLTSQWPVHRSSGGPRCLGSKAHLYACTLERHRVAVFINERALQIPFLDKRLFYVVPLDERI